MFRSLQSYMYIPCLVDTQRDIHQKATYDLADAGLEGIHLSFYLTSIYDHSIFEVSTE